MTEYTEKPTSVEVSTANGVSPGKRTAKIGLAKQDGSESLVLNLTIVFYLTNNHSNLVSLGFFNDAGIYHHNKDQIFYDQNTQKSFTFAKRYKTSFLLYPPNLFAIAVNFLREHKIYNELNAEQNAVSHPMIPKTSPLELCHAQKTSCTSQH